jgi:hypothetical protein
MKNTEYQQSFQSIKSYHEQIHEIVAGRMKNAILDMVYQLFEDEFSFFVAPVTTEVPSAPGLAVIEARCTSTAKEF